MSRPSWRIVDELLTEQRVLASPLPADSLVLTVHGGGASLITLLGQVPSGDWSGTAFVPCSATPFRQPMLSIHLRRAMCDDVALVL
jgi:hypothetical protein